MKQATLDFMVWRAGQSVGWDCTAADIAAEIGISVSSITSVLRRRGWNKRTPGGAAKDSPFDRVPIDQMMKRQADYGNGYM